MKKRVLITGASGFVGFHLIEAAISSDFEVYAAVRSGSQIKHLQRFNIQYVHPNFSAVDELENIINKHAIDYVVHAAGITKAKTEAEYNLTNATYTRNLALASLKAGIKKFVFVSSLAALGPLKDLKGMLHDNSAAHPVTSYGKSKLLAENYLAEIPELPLIVIRPTAVYGPREKDIFILFNSINKGLEPYIGEFDQQLSFVYVKDLAEIIVKALTADVTQQHYNVSDGFVYDRYALADLSKKTLNKKTFKFHLPVAVVNLMASAMELLYRGSAKTPTLNKEKMQELTAVNWACDISAIRAGLGFRPQYNLALGLTETLNWYKQNNWLS
ncbi:MAG: NAD(P)-dependent oxidoreductase [Pedobacter sp.]|nr:MAG: NAD(P)-dependent oxidoreductase [Pedobacter sp.]